MEAWGKAATNGIKELFPVKADIAFLKYIGRMALPKPKYSYQSRKGLGDNGCYSRTDYAFFAPHNQKEIKNQVYGNRKK